MRNHQPGRQNAQLAQVAHGRKAKPTNRIGHLAFRLRQMQVDQLVVLLGKRITPLQQRPRHRIDRMGAQRHLDTGAIPSNLRQQLLVRLLTTLRQLRIKLI